jgi:micrococcal nuclease
MTRHPFLRVYLGAFVAVLLLVGANDALGQSFTGKVVGVKDGDTIEVLRQTEAGPRPVTVRLHGIDAPETGQAYGTRAEQYLANQVFSQTVAVRVTDTDRYGRTVGIILKNGQNLNEDMVRAGYAWWYEQYAPNDAALKQGQSSARQLRRGLWADDNPVPPWEYRNGGQTVADDKDCSDFASYFEALVFFNNAGPGDPHGLDGDGDGEPCESLKSGYGTSPERSRQCCKICRKGKACGDSCIPRSYTCRQPPGCACNG